MGCQASFSCRNWRNWSWPTVLEPPLSFSSTTPSTCPTAWLLNETTDSSCWSTDRLIAILLSASSSHFLTIFSNARLNCSYCLSFLMWAVSLFPLPSTSPHWAGWRRGQQISRKTWKLMPDPENNGLSVINERPWCDVSSDSKFLFQNQQICPLKRAFQKTQELN